MVREHLIELGYDPVTLPATILNEFVVELQELYNTGGYNYLEESTIKSRVNNSKEHQHSYDANVSEFTTTEEHGNPVYSVNNHAGPHILKKVSKPAAANEVTNNSLSEEKSYAFNNNYDDKQDASYLIQNQDESKMDDPEADEELLQRLEALDFEQFKDIIDNQQIADLISQVSVLSQLIYRRIQQ